MKYLSPFTNWRIVLLTILAALTLAFAAGDCDNLALFLASKVAAVILGYITYALWNRWDNLGLITELEVWNDNDMED